MVILEDLRFTLKWFDPPSIPALVWESAPKGNDRVVTSDPCQIDKVLTLRKQSHNVMVFA